MFTGWRAASLRRAARSALAAGFLVLRPMREDLVDDAELESLVGLQERVAVHRAFDVGQRLAGVFGVEIVHPLADAQDLLGLELDVRGHAARTARRLVD